MKYFIGIDLGGTNTKLGIGDKDGNLIIRDTIKTNSINGIDDTLNRIVEKINSMIKEIKIDKNNIKGIGVGIPGPVKKQSIVGFFANFPWGVNVNLKEKIESLTNIETKIDNDVNVIAKGEAIFGAAKNVKSSVTVAIGTGIGAGIFVDGVLISGFNGVGGEIGHIKVIPHEKIQDGKICGCGQIGCFEAYASATGLVREAISRLLVNKENALYKEINGDLNKLEAKHIFDVAKKGDTFSMDLVDYEANWLAIGLGNVLNLINPEMLVLGGGMIESGDFFIEKIKNNLKKYALPSALENIKIEKAELGSNAGIKGAIALFF